MSLKQLGMYNENTIIILKEKDGVFALMPYYKADNTGNVTSYAHTGQHSACSIDYAKNCELATDKEARELIQELRAIGYDEDIVTQETAQWFTGNYRTEFYFVGDIAEILAGSGQQIDNIRHYIKDPVIKMQFDTLAPEEVKKELSDYGAWNDDELINHTDNLERLLWIAAGNVIECNV